MRTIFTLLLTAATAFAVQAQCTPDLTIVEPGFHPNADTSFSRLTDVDFVVQFKNFDIIQEFGGVSVDSIRFDSINDLPNNISWQTDDADKTYSKNAGGCIRFYGNTDSPADNYTATVIFSAWIDGGNTPIQQPSSALGLFLRFEVNETTGIQDATLELVDLKLTPNPFTSNTHISFTSDKAANYKLKVYNTLGELVRFERIDVLNGVNYIDFQRDGLNTGMYLYNISNGTRSISGNMIITD